jgi:hypothetical protein
MSLKNMADWGLHSGDVFFYNFCLIFSKKKFLPLKSIVLKRSPCLNYHHKRIEWNKNNNKLSMKRKTIILRVEHN